MAIINSQKVLGIITEYNPFHNGHAHHIQASKALSGADFVVAVMSAHFTQRGEPAIADPHTRAKWAISSGADLVISLPALFSTASAGYFAYGSVGILDALGMVDSLCFGSESGDIHHLQNMQKLLSQTDSDFKLAQQSDPSLSYQNHRDQFIKIQNATAELSRSNDILGLAYIDALMRLDSSIKALTIERIQSDYKSTALSGNISSATAIRSTILNSGLYPLHSNEHTTSPPHDLEAMDQLTRTMPPAVVSDLFSKENPIVMPNLDLWHEWILFELRRSPLKTLSHVHDMASGLEQRMKTKAVENIDYEAFEEALKTKIFTTGRLKRVMAKLMLGITKDDLLNDFSTSPEYVHILGFNDKGRKLLNRVDSRLPLITNAKHFRPATDSAMRQWEIDCTASNLYHLLLKGNERRGGMTFRQSPLYIK